jgi:hypothetical protein
LCMLHWQRDRLGGRTFTSDALGFPLDLGAAWLHGPMGHAVRVGAFSAWSHGACGVCVCVCVCVRALSSRCFGARGGLCSGLGEGAIPRVSPKDTFVYLPWLRLLLPS